MKQVQIDTARLLARSLLAATLVSPHTAWAIETIALVSPVTYSDKLVGNQKIKDECQVAGVVEDQLLYVLKKQAQGDDVQQPASIPATGLALRVTVMSIEGSGGGSWSGGKGMTVKTELFRDNRQIGSTTLARTTLGGVWGNFNSTCTIVERAALALAKETVKWASRVSAARQENSDTKAESSPDSGENK
ncbi:hypothetical protein [Niveibacterium sp.]|uniref:hypothetical protein n=1 Tax=Niveibacterium sp. TaxID=2017444 RepID=UPI0035B36A62